MSYQIDSYGNVYFPAGVSVASIPATTGTQNKVLVPGPDGRISSASISQLITQSGGNLVSSVYGRTGVVVARQGDYNTDQVTEGQALYFTNDRARKSISVTTFNTSGPATYDSTTGILNIPQYGSGLQGSYVPTSRTITINGQTADLSANRIFSIDSMVYPSAGIPLSNGTSWGTSIVNNSANWNTAFGWGNHAGLYSLLGHTHTFASLTSIPTTLAGYGITDAATSAQGTKADTAFSWGNHALAGYLTSFTETDPTVASYIKAITTTNIANWNSAFSWGNHALAGYLTSFTETDPIWTSEKINYYTKLQADARYLQSYTETDPVWTSEKINYYTKTAADARYLQSYTETDPVWTSEKANYALKTYVDTSISNLVDSAPGTLDTLNELAAALGDDANFSTTVTNLIGTKEPAITAGTTTQYWRGDKTWQTLPVYTLSGLGGVPSTRTLTINGTSYDLSADRSWSITSMIYPSAGIAVSTGSAWGTSITDNSSNWNTAYSWGNHASAGYLTASSAASTYLTISNASSTYLSQSSANTIYLNKTDAASTYLSQSSANTIYLNKTDAASTYLSQSSAASTYLSISNASSTYLSQSSAALTYVSLSGSYSNPSWVTSLAWSKITGAPSFITSYTETDTLSSVTGRGATTSSSLYFSGGSSTTPALHIRSGGTNWSEGLAIHPLTDNSYALAFFRTKSSYTDNTDTWALGNMGETGIINHFALLRRGLTGSSVNGSGNAIFSVNPNGTFSFGFTPNVGSNAIWHAGNLTNLNQLSNGPGYITSYSETDTLSTVTSRGATTASSITTGGLTVNTSGTGTWGPFVVTSTSLWGDGGTQYVTIGAGGSAGIMLFNPHVVWNSGNSCAGIRIGRSGGVSSGAYYEIGTGASDNFFIAKNSLSGGTQFNINSSGNATFSGTISASNFSGSSSGTNTGDQINISGNAATATRLGAQSVDLNSGRTPGTLEYYDQPGGTGAPNTNWHSYISTRHGNAANQYGFQIANQFGTETLLFRGWDGSNPLSWRTVWHSGSLTNLNQLTNGPGYLTGITSANVTTALGYTPYNSSNPSGYIANGASNVGFNATFSGYTSDGLFSANARPITITTPSGDTRIRLGYNDYGGGQYYGRIGFNGPTTWSIGHTGSAGNEFSIGTGFRGDYFKITQGGDYIFESGTGGTSGKVVFKTSDNADLNKYIMQDGYWTVIGTHSNEGLRVRDHNGNILLNVAGSTNGYPLRVGIGTITPGYKLHVAGNMFASSDIHVGADGSVGYVASRIWLYSHDNYRGAGYYMSGTGSTWFAGTPYTNFDGVYMIARRAAASAPDAADPSYRLWQVNNGGSTYQTGDVSATSLHAYSATGRVVAGSWNFDGMLFDSSRSALIARGNYPHIELWSDVSNSNHGGTLRFGGYDNGSSGAYKSWNIGTPGSDLYFLDIGYGGNNSNPHAGIAGLGASYGYAGAFTAMRFHNNGNIGIGNFGTYGNGDNDPDYKLDVRGTGRFTDTVYANNLLFVNTTTQWNQEKFGIQISNSASWSSVPAMMRLTNNGAGNKPKITFTDSAIIDGWLGMVPVSNASYFVMGFAGYTEESFRVYQNGSAIVSSTLTCDTLNTGNYINIGYNRNNESVATSAFRGIDWHTTGDFNYYIGKPAGSWTQPLHIHFYTGIRLRSHSSYGGSHFFNINGGVTTATVNDGDNNLRGYYDIIAYASDRRLKENIQIIDNAVEKIMKLTGMTYNWNNVGIQYGWEPSKEREVGVFAQEVQDVLPEAVKLAPFDNDGGKSKSGENFLTVKYEKLVPLLIEGMKEQQAQIEELKNEIKELKNK